MDGKNHSGANSRRVPQRGFVLPPKAADHLNAAMEQMDLFMTSEQGDDGFEYVVHLLQHLLAVRRIVAEG